MNTLQFDKQLNIPCLQFCKDDLEKNITLTHETPRGGAEDNFDESEDKRMYVKEGDMSRKDFWPDLIQKKQNSSTRMALTDFLATPIWYTYIPVKSEQYSQPEIYKNTGVKRYTAHSIRSTATTGV